MTLAIGVAAALVLMSASVLLHFSAMLLTRRCLRGTSLPRWSGALIGLASVMAAQVMSICLYALAYFGMEWGDLGALHGETEGASLDYLYFSLISYTTLGVGDVHPSGAIRIVSGFEALNGFALIGWTASFAYSLMREGWGQ